MINPVIILHKENIQSDDFLITPVIILHKENIQAG